MGWPPALNRAAESFFPFGAVDLGLAFAARSGGGNSTPRIAAAASGLDSRKSILCRNLPRFVGSGSPGKLTCSVGSKLLESD